MDHLRGKGPDRRIRSDWRAVRQWKELEVRDDQRAHRDVDRIIRVCSAVNDQHREVEPAQFGREVGVEDRLQARGRDQRRGAPGLLDRGIGGLR